MTHFPFPAGGLRRAMLALMLVVANDARAAADPVVAVADAMARPLTAVPGDPASGRALVIAREAGHCIICHHLPLDDVKIFGNVAPALDGVGSRLSAAQLRQRVVDITAVNPQAVMPAFHRVDGLHSVAAEYRGRPLLTAQQVEDVVAFLAGLKG
jgi:sulfur-oxidizing protein SoxX